MSSIIERARLLRSQIEITAQTLDDKTAIENINIFPKWQAAQKYKKDERVRYETHLYRVLKDHTSGSIPPIDISNYKRVVTSLEEVEEWITPRRGNPYLKGERVKYNEKYYESLTNDNYWSPDENPSGWQLLGWYKD